MTECGPNTVLYNPQELGSTRVQDASEIDAKNNILMT